MSKEAHDFFNSLATGGITEQGYMSYGLTKRELFAAMAMQGSIAGDNEDKFPPETHARCAVELADALIAALNAAEGE